jgi:hypothetical protein
VHIFLPKNCITSTSIWANLNTADNFFLSPIQDVAIITWILAMKKSSLSINMQQLKLKVAKIT